MFDKLNIIYIMQIYDIIEANKQQRAGVLTVFFQTPIQHGRAHPLSHFIGHQ